jgi:hypothetical protein
LVAFLHFIGKYEIDGNLSRRCQESFSIKTKSARGAFFESVF